VEQLTLRDIFGEDVLPLFEEGSQQEWLEYARQVARALCERHGETHIDAVRDICPPPEDVDPRIMGAVFKGGEFELVRYTRSMRLTCHRRVIGIHRLKQ